MSAYSNKFKIITLIKSEWDNLAYTKYYDLIEERNKILKDKSDSSELSSEDSEKIMEIESKLGCIDISNYYYGHAEPFQQNGQTKKYKNDNGIFKIETATWIGKEQTPESRKNPKNWDSTKKYFTPAFIKFKKIRFMNENDTTNYSSGIIRIEWENETYELKPGQVIEFGTKSNPCVKIY